MFGSHSAFTDPCKQNSTTLSGWYRAVDIWTYLGKISEKSISHILTARLRMTLPFVGLASVA